MLWCGSALQADQIDYSNLKGARRKNPDTGWWEVGWIDPYYADGAKATGLPGPVYPRTGLEGVIFKAFSGTSTWNRVITPGDIGIDGSRGIPLPLLGITGDIYVCVHRDRECPIRYYADDGTVAQEQWMRWFYPYAIVPGGRTGKRKWLESGCRLEDRPFVQFSRPFTVLLDSRRLDSDGDGVWKPEKLMKIRSYKAPLSVKYVVIVPATTLAVPIPSRLKKASRLSFEYATSNGVAKTEALLDPAFMPSERPVRIGFVWKQQQKKGGKDCAVYVVQNPGRGKEGIIVGKVPVDGNCLAIKPGSLKIEPAEWVPYDRVHVDQRKMIGCEGAPGGDFSAFSMRPQIDWGYHVSYYVRGAKFGSKAVPRRNPFTRIRRDTIDRYHRDALRVQYKYGMRISLDINGKVTQPSCIPDKYKGEELDPNTGRFVKARYLDWANAKAAAWEGENIKRRVAAYRGMPSFVQIHEGIGIRESLNMSSSALASFREFVGDANARFPVPPSYPETSRTTNKEKDVLRILPAYREWRLGYYRGAKFMLGILRPAHEALKGGNFRGAGYFGGARDGGAKFIPYLAKAPEIVLLCAENVAKPDDLHFRIWRDAVKKEAGRIALMAHSSPAYFDATAEWHIGWFTELGLLPEVKGLIHGGGGRVPYGLFAALAAKHFGRGRMTQVEADRAVDIYREKGAFYPRDYARLAWSDARRVFAGAVKFNADGSIDEWPDGAWASAGAEQNLLTGKERWEGQEDLSFRFAVGYDSTNLYISVHVCDEHVVVGEEAASGKGDAIELFLSAAGIRSGLSQQNTFRFRMIPGGKDSNVYAGYEQPAVVPGAVCASRREENGYVVEAAIPWASLSCTVSRGRWLPLEILVIDSDGPGAEIKCSMIWNAGKNKKAPSTIKGRSQFGVLNLR